MITLSILTLALAVMLATIAVLNVVASREAELAPALVDPFMVPHPRDVSADTLPIGCQGQQTLAGEWHETKLARLCDVEDLLDELEACNVKRKELEILGTNVFLVRWR